MWNMFSLENYDEKLLKRLVHENMENDEANCMGFLAQRIKQVKFSKNILLDDQEDFLLLKLRGDG